MSVTYGAGGSTRGYTIKIAEKIQKEQQVTTIAHLTCVGATKADIHAALGQMKEAGIEAPTISCLDAQGNLKQNVLDTLDVIAKYNVILTTGHISHEEACKLIPEAAKRGVKNMVITHVTFPTTCYSVEDQKMFASYGAKMEHCYTTWATGKSDWQTEVEQIRALGAENVILGTDLGQPTAVYPDEGMLAWAEKLTAEGFTAEEIRTMMVYNPRKLLGKD